MISFTLLDIEVAGGPIIDLGANPGSALRGALYDAMRALYDDNTAAHSRNERDNPVAWLMRMEDENTTGGKDVPRPLALRPPLAYTAEQATFGIALYGTAQEYLGLVTSAIGAMARLGVGRGRHRFRVKQVYQVDPLTHQRTAVMDGSGKRLADLQPAPSWEAFKQLAKAFCSECLSVTFLTPTRIVSQGQLCHHPVLLTWVQRLLERAHTLNELYCQEAEWISFPTLLDPMREATVVRDDTHWVEAWSASRREGMMRPTSGFVGHVEYKGMFADLLPYLILGQTLQVGKNTMKGCGWYRLKYTWR